LGISCATADRRVAPAAATSTSQSDIDSGNERVYRGRCKWFNVLKGWGFISPDADVGGRDVFVHQSTLQMPGFRSLDQGEEVEFTVRQADRGCEAVRVTGLNGADCKGSSVHPIGKKKFRLIR
uniref:CSP domain-containing protein n=1 Tax=Soboliphyme baturini TaxID=241478 RepID=A0A183J393_9BILA